MTSSIDYNQMLENQMQEIKHLRECIDNLDRENEEINNKYNELEKENEKITKQLKEYIDNYDSDTDSNISIDE